MTKQEQEWPSHIIKCERCNCRNDTHRCGNCGANLPRNSDASGELAEEPASEQGDALGDLAAVNRYMDKAISAPTVDPALAFLLQNIVMYLESERARVDSHQRQTSEYIRDILDRVDRLEQALPDITDSQAVRYPCGCGWCDPYLKRGKAACNGCPWPGWDYAAGEQRCDPCTVGLSCEECSGEAPLCEDCGKPWPYQCKCRK